MAAIGAKKTLSPARLLAGSVLLLPAAILAFALTWVPVADNLLRSLYEYKLNGPSCFVGLSNYAGLLRDPVFLKALGTTLQVVVVRLAAVLALPALAGWLWARQPRRLRLAAHAAVCLPLALATPVALGLLWSRLWPLATPAGAVRPYLVLEFVYFLGLGGALTGMALTLAWRRPRAGRAVGAVLALAAIVALASGLDSFALPWVSTGGGPANATMTLSLWAFQLGFARMQFGPAAAGAALQLAVALALGVLFGLIVEWFDLRLVSATGAGTHHTSRGRLAAGLPALALLALPAVALYLLSAALGLGQVAQVAGAVPLARAIANGAVAPALAIALVQLPASYLAALSLGLLRPFGRAGSAVASTLLIAGGFVPALVWAMPLFLAVRQAHLMSTLPAVALPLLTGPASYLVFRLYFAGKRVGYDQACANGVGPFAAFFRVVLVPSLPVGVLAGAAALLCAGQSLVWPLAVLANPREFSLSMALLRLARDGGPATLRPASAWLLWTVWGSAFLALWWPLGILLERLQLVAGEEPAPPESAERGDRPETGC